MSGSRRRVAVNLGDGGLASEPCVYPRNAKRPGWSSELGPSNNPGRLLHAGHVRETIRAPSCCVSRWAVGVSKNRGSAAGRSGVHTLHLAVLRTASNFNEHGVL